jgi:asparagine synthase (glutamine-hydrolysing)
MSIVDCRTTRSTIDNQHSTIAFMCGFAGVIAWDEKYRVDRATLGRMSAAIAHRGPDGEGIYLDDQHEITPQSPLVGLAFRRLAIIDLDERSNQPFISTDKRYVMVFNGEIYNYRELRSEISKLLADYHWRTTGDTETLLMSYVVWKEKCVEHLNGMFALAIWDNVEKSLYLARDRMGQKPLYYAHLANNQDGTTSRASGYSDKHTQMWAFSSELGALLELPGRMAGEIRPGALRTCTRMYLRWGCFSARITPFDRIGRIPPGNWEKIDATSAEAASYFYAARFPRSVSTPGMTRSLVTQAVSRQLVADVPVGCFLSGGIDSSIIAAAMKRVSADVHTFSLGFDDPRYDESSHAEAVARHLGTTHHSLRASPAVAEDLPRLARIFGEPFGDSSALPTHYLSQETRKFVKVALSGDGGDELFGGYDRYRAIEWAARLAGFPLEGLANLAGSWVQGHPKSRVTRASRFFATLNMPLEKQYSCYLRIFDDQTISELTDGAIDSFDEVDWMYRDMLNDGARPAEAGLAVDRVTYLPDDLLTKVDRCSMLHGLEVRSPFMDHELVQFAAGLTTDQLLKGGKKRMLREAFAKDLPDFVFKRKKMGFAVPIGEWFRGELRAMLRDHLFATDGFCRQHFNMKVVERLVDEHEQERVDHSQRLYALLMLEMWWIHVVKATGVNCG